MPGFKPSLKGIKLFLASLCLIMLLSGPKPSNPLNSCLIVNVLEPKIYNRLYLYALKDDINDDFAVVELNFVPERLWQTVILLIAQAFFLRVFSSDTLFTLETTIHMFNT